MVFWRVRVGILARTHSDCNVYALPVVPVRCLQYWWLNCVPFDVTKKIFFFASCVSSFSSCFSVAYGWREKTRKEEGGKERRRACRRSWGHSKEGTEDK